MSSFNITDFDSLPVIDQYQKRLAVLKEKLDTKHIEQTVTNAGKNLGTPTKPFVIYGDPQSGKTEMMICLTAYLLDQGVKTVIHLLNDDVELLKQSMERFQTSGLIPSPSNYKTITDPKFSVDEAEPLIVFCKKNSKNLKKLIDKLKSFKTLVIVDDEADYASPNGKINKQDKTKINKLIGDLIGKNGIYIGVTATPARLNLNKTFDNDPKLWVEFGSHSKYTGPDTFFPLDHNYPFKLTWVDPIDTPEQSLKKALFSFMVNAAYLNLNPDKIDKKAGEPSHFSFIIHKSGSTADHGDDYHLAVELFATLKKSHKDYKKNVQQLFEIAQMRYSGKEKDIVTFILQHLDSKNIIIMNSKKEISDNYENASNPTSIFTVIVGGNKVSRGITFNNLLGMYFHREAKKIQQDTYIQRARMFGARGKTVPYFELTIPKELYSKWHKCFVFHRLSVKSIKSGNGVPVWLENKDISVASKASVDSTNVSITHGEMSFSLFDYSTSMQQQIDAIIGSPDDGLVKMQKLQKLLGEDNFPAFNVEFIASLTDKPGEIKIHPTQSTKNMKSLQPHERATISRRRGFLGGASFTKDVVTIHHLRVIHNEKGKARLFYRYMDGVSFLKYAK